MKGESSRVGLYLLVFTLVAAAEVRLAHLGVKSFWNDEGATYWFASLSLHDLFATLPFESNPPLFYLLAKAWLAFGHGDVWARLLPFLFGLAGVALTFMAAREVWGNRDSALVAAALAAMSPALIKQSQNFRTYTLLYALMVLAIFFLWRWSRSERKEFLAAFMFTTALAFYAHYAFVFYMPALSVGGLILVWPNTRLRNTFIVWHLFLAILIAPNLYYFIENTKHVLSDFWIEPLTLQNSLEVVGSLIGMRLVGVIVQVAIVLLAVSRPSRTMIALLVIAYLPVGMVIVASLVFKPLLLPRTIISSIPALLVLAGGAFHFYARGSKYLKPVITAGLIFAVVAFHTWYTPRSHEQWRAVVRTVLDRYQDGDVVVFAPGTAEWTFKWYESAITTQPVRKWGYPYRLVPAKEAPCLTSAREPDIAEFWRGLGRPPRVWLVVRMLPRGDMGPLIDSFAVRYTQTMHWTFTRLRVYLYESH